MSYIKQDIQVSLCDIYEHPNTLAMDNLQQQLIRELQALKSNASPRI